MARIYAIRIFDMYRLNVVHGADRRISDSRKRSAREKREKRMRRNDQSQLVFWLQHLSNSNKTAIECFGTRYKKRRKKHIFYASHKVLHERMQIQNGFTKGKIDFQYSSHGTDSAYIGHASSVACLSMFIAMHSKLEKSFHHFHCGFVHIEQGFECECVCVCILGMFVCVSRLFKSTLNT